MNQLIAVLPMFLTLILCVANVYSMIGHRISTKKPFLLFAVVTLTCFVFNSYIILFWGSAVFHDIMLITVAVPYFILFLVVSKDKISQIFFHFWLWVNIYAFITNSVKLINDITFRDRGFENALRIIVLFVYFVLYNKYLKLHHRRILETPNINWWVFSLIPLFFEVLIIITHRAARVPEGFSRNYPLLLVIFVLMLSVYVIIFYTFQKANDAAKSEFAKAMYSQQLESAKAQISFMNDTQMQTAVYRHDMRHNLTAIDAFLSTDNVQQARTYIKEVQEGIEALTLRHFCQNNLVNLLCSSFAKKAEYDGVRLTVNTELPEKLKISDMELCAILSNGLENALHAVSELPPTFKWIELYGSIRQNNLLIEIQNPCESHVHIRDGLPVSTGEGHGYGCRSIRSIAEQNRGICIFEVEHGVFTLRVVLPLSSSDCTQ